MSRHEIVFPAHLICIRVEALAITHTVYKSMIITVEHFLFLCDFKNPKNKAFYETLVFGVDTRPEPSRIYDVSNFMWRNFIGKHKTLSNSSIYGSLANEYCQFYLVRRYSSYTNFFDSKYAATEDLYLPKSDV